MEIVKARSAPLILVIISHHLSFVFASTQFVVAHASDVGWAGKSKISVTTTSVTGCSNQCAKLTDCFLWEFLEQERECAMAVGMSPRETIALTGSSLPGAQHVFARRSKLLNSKLQEPILFQT